jgi:hypothetical protein
VLDVPGRPHGQEGHPAVLFDLGPLATLGRVLDRELVEFEDGRDVLDVGQHRLVQAQPDKRVVPQPGRGQRLGVVEVGRLSFAADVVAAVDDRVPVTGRSRRHRPRGRREDAADRAHRGGDGPAQSAGTRDGVLRVGHVARPLSQPILSSVTARK